MTIDAFEYANIMAAARIIKQGFDYCRYDKSRVVAGAIVAYLQEYSDGKDKQAEFDHIIAIVKEQVKGLK